ncbi:MAG: nucleotidyltransferase domain-containing protein [Candidatus Asgardarchaeia archaeon]
MKLEIFKYRREQILKYPEMFNNFVDKLINAYNGQITIILFGSRGRKTNRESSDFDIIIVLQKKTSEDYKKIYQLKPTGLPADIIILTPDELNDKVIKQMLVGSTIIYNGLNWFKKEKE